MRVRKGKSKINKRYNADSQKVGAAKRYGLARSIECKEYYKIKKEKTQGPRGIFQEAFNREGKIEEGIKALIENGIDPKKFGVQILKTWAEEAIKTKENTTNKVNVDEGR